MRASDCAIYYTMAMRINPLYEKLERRVPYPPITGPFCTQSPSNFLSLHPAPSLSFFACFAGLYTAALSLRLKPISVIYGYIHFIFASGTNIVNTRHSNLHMHHSDPLACFSQCHTLPHSHQSSRSLPFHSPTLPTDTEDNLILFALFIYGFRL